MAYSYIAGNFGEVVHVRLAMDHTVCTRTALSFTAQSHSFLSCLCKLNVDLQVNLPKGSGYVEFKMRADAEKAQAYMDGVRLDYNAERYN